jgi:hypothetical protein
MAERSWMPLIDFEAQVTGRATKVFDADGTLFGIEYFLPKHRVIWQLAGENQCYFGTWSVQDDVACYLYEGGFGNCYRYFSEADGLVSVDWVAGKQTTSTHRLVVVDGPLPTCPAE